MHGLVPRTVEYFAAIEIQSLKDKREELYQGQATAVVVLVPRHSMQTADLHVLVNGNSHSNKCVSQSAFVLFGVLRLQSTSHLHLWQCTGSSYLAAALV